MAVELLRGLGIAVVYYIAFLAVALPVRRFARVPKEISRKALHFMLLGSVFIFTLGFETWWLAAVASVMFLVVVLIALAVAERFLPGYSSLLTERKAGELKRSAVAIFFVFAILITICWGLLGEKLLVIASVMAWGLGDAAAALIGKRFGRSYLSGEYVEGKKSLEGSIAMLAVSFVSVLVILAVMGPEQWYEYIPVALNTAIVCTLVELFTKNGMDTITCPLAAACVLIPMLDVLKYITA
ncbi:MAG: phosphatidate cytidylyltransferase [Clostridiaceae bacterium]|nr:phosphatidate cytidylyltransferase [Clostridiaceae bacterium]